MYIFMTWMLSDVNSVFMGTHAYLNIPAIGASVYLSIIIYLIYLKTLSSKPSRFRFLISISILSFCILIFYQISSRNIDKYFSYWLKNGYRYADQERIRNTFWGEIGKDKQFSIDNPALIYLDGFQDSTLGMYYENALVWKIPAYLLVETGKTLAACDLIMYKVDIKEIKIKVINGKKVITQDRCDSKLVYPIENFFAFKLINRDITPIKSEILEQLGVEPENTQLVK